MSLQDIFRSQFIDIVEWPEESGVLVHRFNRHDNEIKNHAKLIVRPGQAAVFVNEGRIADHFGPGTYTLNTANVPILTNLLSLPTNFKSWHKAEVYFIKTTEQLDRHWGTPQPIMMRDPDFDKVRLRAFGIYSYCVGMADSMLERFVGAKSDYSAEDLERQIAGKIITELTDSLGELRIPALDLAAKYHEIGERVFENLGKTLKNMGLELSSFTISSISLPEEVNKAIDKLSSAEAMTDSGLNKYTRMQTADAILAAAQNPGTGGSVVGMMMGGNMAGMMNSTMQQSQQQPQAVPPPPPAETVYYLAVNGQRQGPFNTATLSSMAMNGTFTASTLVWCAGMAGWQAAETIPALASVFASVPPPPPPPLP